MRRPTRLPRRPGHRPATTLLATAVLATVGVLGACSSVTPAGTSASGGASGGTGGGAAADSYGSPAGASAVKDGGDLVVALSAEPDALDPATSRSLYSRYVFQTMCQKLYDVDQSTKIVPQLATALPTVSDGGKTVTIPVRTGITFSDGTPFDATAVKASLERELTLKTSARRSELGPIASIQAPDASTVVITLKAPFAPLTAALTDRAGMIVSPTAAQKLGTKFGSAPVCVGPFKFSNRVPQSSIEVVKDPSYYDAKNVHLDKITYRIITDASIRAANIKSGDAQVADSISTQDVASLSSTSGLTVLQSPSLGYQGLTFNIGNTNGVGETPGQIDTPEAKNPLVRQAFSMAIDRQSLNQVVFNGAYAPACSPIAPQTEYSSEAAQACPAHDPAKAKQLLQQAGVQVPFPLAMQISNNPDSLRLGQALQAMVKEGGFDLQIKPVEYSALLDLQDKGDFSLVQLGWSGRIDPDANITNFVGTGGSQNVSGFSDPSLDALLDQARQTQDAAKRQDLYGQVVTKLEQSDPIVYLYRQRNLTAVSSKVLGVQVFPDGVIRLAGAGLAR
ncbi:ABC transporter substrate-binding protein [Lapillicoccus jejuensis]|uniref:Peptide/nickel transport system substrate-binding protein n=1 Tax=Lapillicoccus jejuensis TaxID=402171 RepID=A0A542DYY8_9MICO|nr:ABC transporter substrate-binding protein [Lapillicoccus jejuensis]TQJ08144.1 peptide/nickel transport system substrate-binding protein [Lapillicoccus jejuensis]